MSKNLLQILQEYGIEQFGRFYSVYRGIVTNNYQDEENTMNIIEVSIPSIYDTVLVNARPKGFHGGPNNGFQYLLPKVGQIVYVEFEYGDITRALWSYHGWAKDERPDEFDKDTIGLITPNGNKIILKEEDGVLYVQVNQSIKLMTSEDNYLHINEEGKVVDLVSTDINFIEGKVGIPESTTLVKQLNNIESLLKELIKVFNSHTHTGSSPSGPVTTVATITQVIDNLKQTIVDDISSKHIKQPN